jgi:hypothetical protein
MQDPQAKKGRIGFQLIRCRLTTEQGYPDLGLAQGQGTAQFALMMAFFLEERSAFLGRILDRLFGPVR